MSLKSLLGGVIDGELGHPDLLRRVVDGIAKLRRHADRGVEVLPPEVEVHITVGEGSVQVIERFVNDPSFDREVEAALRNKLVRAREDRMPVRRYFVKAGKKTQVTVKESAPKTYQLKIEGGDRAGTTVPMQGEKRVFLVGRGPWHGDEQQVANDIIVSETEKGISTIDADGVALAAIQGLHLIVQEKDARIAALENAVLELKRVVEALATKQ